MSTRSAIGYLKEDESVVGVYCHFDGYLSGVGRTLHENYNSEDKILELINLGYISSLEETVEDTSDRRHHTNIKPSKFADIFGFEHYFQYSDYLYIYDSVEEEWKYKKYGEEYYHRFSDVFAESD